MASTVVVTRAEIENRLSIQLCSPQDPAVAEKILSSSSVDSNSRSARLPSRLCIIALDPSWRQRLLSDMSNPGEYPQQGYAGPSYDQQQSNGDPFAIRSTPKSRKRAAKIVFKLEKATAKAQSKQGKKEAKISRDGARERVDTHLLQAIQLQERVTKYQKKLTNLQTELQKAEETHDVIEAFVKMKRYEDMKCKIKQYSDKTQAKLKIALAKTSFKSAGRQGGGTRSYQRKAQKYAKKRAKFASKLYKKEAKTVRRRNEKWQRGTKRMRVKIAKVEVQWQSATDDLENFLHVHQGLAAQHVQNQIVEQAQPVEAAPPGGFGPPMPGQFGPPPPGQFGPPMPDQFRPPMQDQFGPPPPGQY